MTLHDEAVYKSFLASPEVRDFISASPPEIAPVELSPTIFRFTIKPSNNFKTYERTDYQILTFIGDVGALYQTLRDLLAVFLAYVLKIEVDLKAHLINSVFRRKSRKKDDNKELLYPKSNIDYFFKVCHFCGWRKRKEF